MNFKEIIRTWQAIPVEARVKYPQSELEYQQLLELLDQMTDEMALHGETVEESALRQLFDLTCAYVLKWETTHEAPIEATPREVLRQLLEEQQLSLMQLERERPRP